MRAILFLTILISACVAQTSETYDGGQQNNPGQDASPVLDSEAYSAPDETAPREPPDCSRHKSIIVNGKPIAIVIPCFEADDKYNRYMTRE